MSTKRQLQIQALLAVAVIIVVQLLSQYVYFRWDLTEDDRFTITEGTRRVLDEMEHPIFAELLLPEDLPKDFAQLREASVDLLERYRDLTGGRFHYETLDPSDGDAEYKAMMAQGLAEQGMLPVSISVGTADKASTRSIYPYIRLTMGARSNAVAILERQSMDRSPQQQLNQSIAMLEHKLTLKLDRLINVDRPTVGVLRGHGEPGLELTKSMMDQLSDHYRVGTLYLDSVFKIDPRISCVIIQGPTKPFSPRDQFILDQYVMNGGKLIWMVDRLNVSLDSLRNNAVYVPFDLSLDLEGFFFKHGIRINTDAIQDSDCTPIPLATGLQGQERYELYPWPYHVKALPNQEHVITRGLGRVEMKFPSTLDTLKSKYGLKKTVLLTSSENSRFIFSPMQLSLNDASQPIPAERLDKSYLPTAVLLEGKFASLFENRVSQSMMDGLAKMGETYRDQSEDNKMLIVTDGAMMRSSPRAKDQNHWPVGFNIFDGKQYANMEFILNALEYMVGDEDVIASRKRRVTLRLMDKVRASNERSYWQLINVGLPVFMLIVTGVWVTWSRRRKYARHRP